MRSAPIEILKLYYELCLPSIVGKQKWRMNHAHIGIRTLTTVADEALVALIIENNIEEWIVLSKGGTIEAKNRLTLYTHGGHDARGTRKGWSLEGRKRYNYLHNEIKKLRKMDAASNIDNKLKELWKKGTLTVPNKDSTVSDQDGNNVGKKDEVFEPVFDFDD